MRARWLQEQNKGRGLVLATGTPIANTLVELYNMQRYLQFDELTARGIAAFDARMNTFAEPVTKVERLVTGEYGLVTRLSSFVNLPELLQISHQIMDVQRADDMPEYIKRPKRRDEAVTSPKSPELDSFMRELVARADLVRKKKVRPDEDNMLKISTDGRKASLDMRLVAQYLGLPHCGYD